MKPSSAKGDRIILPYVLFDRTAKLNKSEKPLIYADFQIFLLISHNSGPHRNLSLFSLKLCGADKGVGLYKSATHRKADCKF